MAKYSRMIRVEEGVEESYERNFKFLSLEDRIDRLTPKQKTVALKALASGKSLVKAIVFAENHPKR